MAEIKTDRIDLMQEIRKIIKLPDNPDSTEGYFTKEELKDILVYLQIQNGKIKALED